MLFFFNKYIKKIKRFFFYWINLQKRKKNYINYIEVNIAEHCNLNCAYCSHFSPLSDEYFYNIDQFEQDIKRIAELTKSKLNYLRILGGEPLLHEECKNFLKISRIYFPNTEIRVVTNGILLQKQDDTFFDICKENNILIECSKYPINFDYEKLQEFLKTKKVNFAIVGSECSHKFFQRIRLTQKGNISFFNSYVLCFWPMRCTNLKNGRLYLCPIVANIHILNKFFNTKFEVSKKDYIDIYKVNDEKEILKYIHKKIPFCRYCNFSKTNIKLWKISKKELSEWVEN